MCIVYILYVMCGMCMCVVYTCVACVIVCVRDIRLCACSVRFAGPTGFKADLAATRSTGCRLGEMSLTRCSRSSRAMRWWDAAEANTHMCVEA